MSTVTIKLAPAIIRTQIYCKHDTDNLVNKYFSEYEVCKSFTVKQAGSAAAEEAFDVTNNPARQHERETVYGTGRSVSVGDVVEVDGIDYVCNSFGWDILA
jgi:hypothetical protein